MGAALYAFGRALWSQLHYRMLLLTFLPFLLSAVAWGVALWLGLQPMIDWLQAWFLEHQGFGVAGRVLGWVGLGALKTVIVPLIAMWVLLPLMILTALLCVAVLAIPAIVKHVSYRYYPALEERRGGTFFGSLWTFCSSFVIFLALWLITLPLALIPPLTFVVQPLLWGWLTYRVMAYDALARACQRRRAPGDLAPASLAAAADRCHHRCHGSGAGPAVAGRRAVGDFLSAAGGRRDLAVRAGVRVYRLVVPALLPGRAGALPGTTGTAAPACVAGCGGIAAERHPLTHARGAQGDARLMAIGLIIIGDEILSGKRLDKHFSQVVAILAARGLQLGWAEFIGDDRARITATLRRTLASDDIVFSCGGIGATPDDHTRQCAAAALGVPLQLHPEAKRLIQERIIEMARAGGR